MTSAIELTAEEEELASEIIFDPEILIQPHNPDKVIANGELAAQLFESLRKRDAIPQLRWDYFTKAQYNISTPKTSRAERFLQNAGSPENVVRHVHFLNYLSYFIYGAALPPDVIADFEKASLNVFREWDDLKKLTSKLAKKAKAAGTVKDYKVADEFFRLALDCGCNLTEARQVRDAAQRAVK